jgi:AcrR family transcriptional regulator
MSGKIQFDEGAAIEAAVTVFWRHGYAAASISDLTEATGLSRSSIYQRFRDKDGLFVEALQSYTDRVMYRMNAVKADTSRGRIEAVLRAFLPDESKPKRPGGCLIARSCAEVADLSPKGQAAALAAAARQRDFLASILRKGVETGEWADDADVDALAWYYLGVLQAILNFAYIGADHHMLGRMINLAMAAWKTSGCAASP